MIDESTKLTPVNTKFNGMYRALVMDNDDPLQYGRIKARVYPMLSDLIADELPWATPAFPLWNGSGSASGFFAVPKVGTYVFVFFEGGEFWSPTYFAEAPTATKGLPATRTNSYPNRRVLRTDSGWEVYFDDTLKEFKLTHPDGAYIMIMPDGTIQINSPADVIVRALKNITISAGQHAFLEGAGTVKINSSTLLDFCTSLLGWSSAITGLGAVTASVLGGLSVFNFNSGTSIGGAIQAGLSRVLGTLPSQFTVATRLLHENIGTLASGDYFGLDIAKAGVKNAVALASDGLFVHNGVDFQKIASNVVEGQWQDWKFSIDNTVPATAKMSAYLGGELIDSAIPCGQVGGFVEGTMDLAQKGESAASRITNTNLLQVVTGLVG